MSKEFPYIVEGTVTMDYVEDAKFDRWEYGEPWFENDSSGIIWICWNEPPEFAIGVCRQEYARMEIRGGAVFE